MSNARSTDPNDPDHPIEPIFRKRWSPYRFDDQGVEQAKLLSCLEAARWAASSFNDQPWSWIVARREDSAEFQAMLDCLLEANREWAKHAGVLMITVIRTAFRQNGKPNRVALHDLGQASAHLALQATAQGLQVHQMAGVNLSRTRMVYEIPESHEPQTAIAIGYPELTDPESETAQELERRQSQPRTRLGLDEQVFAGKYGKVAELG